MLSNVGKEIRKMDNKIKDNDRFGTQSGLPCVVCGGYNHNQYEPRFGYSVCINHKNMPPAKIRK